MSYHVELIKTFVGSNACGFFRNLQKKVLPKKFTAKHFHTKIYSTVDILTVYNYWLWDKKIKCYQSI